MQKAMALQMEEETPTRMRSRLPTYNQNNTVNRNEL
jgi:hypothetical protein